MRVAIVQAPVWWTLDPPLGPAQIAGCLRHYGHEVFVFDLNILLWKDRLTSYESLWLWEQSHFWNHPSFVSKFFADHAARVDACVEDILRTDAKVIGFSVCSGSQLATLELARRLKSADPKRKVILGGQYFFFGDKISEVLLDPGVDAVVQGAGDAVFPELLKALDQSGELEPLAGIWLKRGSETLSGGPPSPVQDLDRVPFADFTGFPMELYTDPVRIPIKASRGCVWQCRFCSARAFWKGYAYMGGDRIFAEVMHHKRQFPGRCHLEFYDITANGDVRALQRFSRLAAEAIRSPEKFFGWKINAVLRPEMTPEVLRDLRAGNCHDIIYGIESGSPRVLKAMKKGFSIDVAERVLADTRRAGILTTGNFMFGLPGETEEDFQETLHFLRRNRDSFDRVYASATFTSLEEHSFLTEHLEESGIRPVPQERFHNLYWESADGTNTYPVRLDRYLRFRELAVSLGIDAYKGVNGALDQDRLSNLAQYHHHSGRPLTALRYFLDYLELDLYHEPTRRHLARQRGPLSHLQRAQKALDKANRLAPRLGGVGPLWEDLGERWGRQATSLEGFLMNGRSRDPETRLLARLLLRALHFLKLLEGEKTRIAWEEGRFFLYWSEERVPEFQELSQLRDRAELVYALAEIEIARGEDRKPTPVCAR